MRLHTRFYTSIAIPLVGVVLLGGAAAAGVLSDLRALDMDRANMAVASAAGQIVVELATEMGRAAQLAANPSVGTDALEKQAEATDRAFGALSTTSGDVGVQASATQVTQMLSTIAKLRRQVLAGKQAAGSVAEYGPLLQQVQNLRRLALGGVHLLNTDAAAADALSGYAVSAGWQQAAALQLSNTRTDAALTGLVSAHTAGEQARTTFLSLAPTAWKQLWSSAASHAFDALYTAAVARSATAADVTRWTDALLTLLQTVQAAQSAVDADLMAAVTRQRTAQLQLVWTVAGAAVLILLIATWIARRNAHSLGRRLGDLRDAAQVVANEILPQAVERMRAIDAMHPRRAKEDAVRTRIPLGVVGRDEVSDVANSLETVSRTALRMASTEAALRSSVNAMVATIARRVQVLLDHVFVSLDGVQQDETDTRRLRQLFVLDHRAAQLGWLAESLLIVAGTPSTRMRMAPATVADVLMAAASQVQAYERVEYGLVDAGISVRPHVVDHLVHALAGLMDNALRFSPPDQPVLAEARFLRGGHDVLVIHIGDRGIGIDERTLAELNKRLAQPEQQLDDVNQIGIATIAQVSNWHNLSVTLTSRIGGGVLAEIIVPPEHLEARPPAPPETTGQPPAFAAIPRRHAAGERPAAVGLLAAAPSAPVVAAVGVPETSTPAQRAAAQTDIGWRAATAAQWPQAASRTQNGLPVRNPGAQLVPGGIDTPAGQAPRRDMAKAAEQLRRMQRADRIRTGRRRNNDSGEAPQ